MSGTAFLPMAVSSLVAPGKYKATCTAVHQPELYRAFSRWYLRLDFAINDDGSIVSKYLNLGTGKEPNTQLGPRSDYYRLWSMAVGREPTKNEQMDPAKIIGVEFAVTVVSKQRHGGGEYSVISELECLSSMSNGGSLLTAQCSLLKTQDSRLGTPTLNAQALSRSSLSAAQVCLNEGLYSHNTNHMSRTVTSEQHRIGAACEPAVSTMCNSSEPHVMRLASPTVPPKFAGRAADYEEAMRNSSVLYRDGHYYHAISGREINRIEAENVIELRIQAQARRKTD